MSLRPRRGNELTRRVLREMEKKQMVESACADTFRLRHLAASGCALHVQEGDRDLPQTTLHFAKSCILQR